MLDLPSPVLEEMLLTVAIVTRNRALQVIESLRAVALQLAPGDDLLVVDDGSDDGSTAAVSEWIGEHLPAARFVATAYRGVSEARNTALAEARSGTVCFIDDDATPCDGWLAALRNAWRSASPRVAVIGGPIRPGWQSRPPWLIDELLYVVSVLDHGPTARQLSLGNHCWAANMSVRRATVLQAGGFDPAWGYAPGRIGGRGEEDELQRRLTHAGYAVFWVPRAAVVHRLSPERLTIDYFRRFMADQDIRIRDSGQLSRREALYRTLRTGARYVLSRVRRDSVDATVASIFFAGYSTAAFSLRCSDPGL